MEQVAQLPVLVEHGVVWVGLRELLLPLMVLPLFLVSILNLFTLILLGGDSYFKNINF